MQKISALILLSLITVGCQHQPTGDLSDATSLGSEEEIQWVRTELYFAIGLAPESPGYVEGETRFGEAGWTEFVDEVVTPLFPDGLTVFPATGQWLSERFDSPPKLATRVLVILHPDSEEANERIDSVRTQFLEITGQQSVLRVSQAAEVSF